MKYQSMSVDKRESGSIPILVLMILPLLLAMVGIGGDIGKLYVSKSELQSAADACALAAAAKFDGSANQNDKALDAGIAVAQQNKVIFQKEVIDDVEISFPNTLNGVAGKYVQCEIQKTNIANWITPVLNLMGGVVAESETIQATAVAAILPGQTACALPIAVCESGLAGKKRGDWIEGVSRTSDDDDDDDHQSSNGNFRWVDLTPESNGGANEIANILDGTNATSCNVSTTANTVVTKKGFNANAIRAYNTRFGIKQSNNTPTPLIHVTGKGYYLQSNKSVPGRFDSTDYANAAKNNTGYTNISGINISPLRTSTTSQHRSGKPDSRIATVAVVDCANMRLKSFACVFLLHPLSTTNQSNFKMYLEYLGNPSTAITPCNTSSSFAGSGIGPSVSALVK
jgi:hypothetical protein